jgi:hypothetical protein
MPRVGNDAYASFYDAKASRHINVGLEILLNKPLHSRCPITGVSIICRILFPSSLGDSWVIVTRTARFIFFLKVRLSLVQVRFVAPLLVLICNEKIVPDNLGDDNAIDKECQVLSVPVLAAGKLLNHLGPYEGIWIGTIFCN